MFIELLNPFRLLEVIFTWTGAWAVNLKKVEKLKKKHCPNMHGLSNISMFY